METTIELDCWSKWKSQINSNVMSSKQQQEIDHGVFKQELKRREAGVASEEYKVLLKSHYF